ncbi:MULTISPECIES: 3-phosphoshikimate 1-carboxyvinyltransferase [unclassified Oscillibacter]|uniref:3-phosphoshikimate 1-carboxyvinyltransferase n=1 Tax=unclassified Oscillibacter TaxID=2629304 RepID=UPI0025FCE72F|nr:MULTISPECIES: 3-phosphoshikimate 1-carboxyvinyltransferase [unclassified Oscillibacter]
MDMHISPALLRGAVTPPPSKSMAHRLLISAALAEGTSIIHNVALSQDIEATLRCVEALGCSWEQAGPFSLRIHGCGPIVPTDKTPRFDCGESGSTLRFFIPLALAIAGSGAFTGRGRLMERPQAPYFDLFDEKGIAHSMENGVLTVRGALKSGEYSLPGDVSSQFFTGLLFALPLLKEDSVIVSSTKPESVDYIAMTVEALRAAGIRVLSQPAQRRWTVSSGRFHSFNATVEADWSQAAFWYAANVLGSTLRLEGLDPKSSQGDRVAAEYAVQLSQPGDVEIDVSGCPDLVPPLAVMAAARQGICRFTNAARLRLKESDRLKTTAALLRALGGNAEDGADSLTVHGVSRLSGGAVDGAGDHRIVMAAAIAATCCAGPVTILGAEAVNKSYPSFFEDYLALGGDAHVV